MFDISYAPRPMCASAVCGGGALNETPLTLRDVFCTTKEKSVFLLYIHFWTLSNIIRRGGKRFFYIRKEERDLDVRLEFNIILFALCSQFTRIMRLRGLNTAQGDETRQTGLIFAPQHFEA